jgi:hypothetical protein
VEPLSPARYLLEFSIPASTHAKLRRAQALLSHAEPDPDLARVLDRALDALIERLERRKAGAARRPARLPRPSRHARHIPAHVRRAVWERDRGRCTFVGPGGRVCGVTRRIEFDHVDPVARGGRASVDGVRLRCRAHNQFEAERVFGVEFMRGKRAQRRAAAADRPGPARGPGGWAEADARTREVVAGLRALGMRGAEARHAASIAAPAAGASIEEHLRAALRTHLGRGIRFTASTPHPPG